MVLDRHQTPDDADQLPAGGTIQIAAHLSQGLLRGKWPKIEAQRDHHAAQGMNDAVHLAEVVPLAFADGHHAARQAAQESLDPQEDLALERAEVPSEDVTVEGMHANRHPRDQRRETPDRPRLGGVRMDDLRP